MIIKRYELTGSDGWLHSVLRVDREVDGVLVRAWSSNGRALAPSPDGHALLMLGSDIQFVLPDDE
jgi:hypothetical protein